MSFIRIINMTFIIFYLLLFFFNFHISHFRVEIKNNNIFLKIINQNEYFSEGILYTKHENSDFKYYFVNINLQQNHFSYICSLLGFDDFYSIFRLWKKQTRIMHYSLFLRDDKCCFR